MINGNIWRRILPHSSFVSNTVMRYQLYRVCKEKLDNALIVKYEKGEIPQKDMLSQLDAMDHAKVEKLKREMTELGEKVAREFSDDDKAEAIWCNFMYGFECEEYFVFNLKEKSTKERKAYMSFRDKTLLSKGMNEIFDRENIAYKDFAYYFFKKYYKREAYRASEITAEQFNDFVESHGCAVIKDPIGCEGKEVFLVRKEEMGSPESYYNEKLKGTKLFIEQRIVQSDYMASLSPSSVNTVRVVTFKTKDEIVIPTFCCFIRTGQKGSFVDNAFAGGIFAGLDPVTGCVSTVGHDMCGNTYERHPETGTVYNGFQLPDWDKAIQMAKEAAAMIPSVRYISWDFAHTNEGWIIVESNECGALDCQQIVQGRGIKQAMIKLIEESDAPLKGLVLEGLKE